MAVEHSFSFKRTLLALAIGLSSTTSFASEQTSTGTTESDQEELTIVIVKKPSKETATTEQNDSPITAVTEFSNHNASDNTVSQQVTSETKTEEQSEAAPAVVVSSERTTKTTNPATATATSETTTSVTTETEKDNSIAITETPVDDTASITSTSENEAAESTTELTEITSTPTGQNASGIENEQSFETVTTESNTPVTDFTENTSTYSDDYYGNYIPPQRQIDSYYSSDITEAINASENGTLNSQVHVASVGIPAMEHNEMSDLVVEGALDATAAGDVSTTTLKTAVVIPDDSIFGDLEQTPDEDAEEIKEALVKKDLSKRVKDALELLGRTQNHAGSTGSSTAGTMTASGVRVTATISSRPTTTNFSAVTRDLNNGF